MKPWHQDTTFWKKTAPFMFDEQRWKKTPRQVARYIKLLKIKQGMRVLDLCCGPGRISLELARRGYSVTGVDHMPHALREARQRAAKEDLSCRFVRGDMRIFRKPRSFDAVFDVFTSFGYFKNQKDNQQVLANIHASLKPGGKLLMELTSREVVRKNFKPKDWDELGGEFLIEECIPKKNWTWLKNRWIHIDARGRAQEFEVSHYLYGIDDLSRMLKKAGFSHVKAHDVSKRLILVATK